MKALQNCAYDMTLQHRAAAIEPLWFALLDDNDCIIVLMLQLLRILSRAYLLCRLVALAPMMMCAIFAADRQARALEPFKDQPKMAVLVLAPS